MYDIFSNQIFLSNAKNNDFWLCSYDHYIKWNNWQIQMTWEMEGWEGGRKKGKKKIQKIEEREKPWILR